MLHFYFNRIINPFIHADQYICKQCNIQMRQLLMSCLIRIYTGCHCYWFFITTPIWNNWCVLIQRWNSPYQKLRGERDKSNQECLMYSKEKGVSGKYFFLFLHEYIIYWGYSLEALHRVLLMSFHNPCPAELGYVLSLQTVQIQISWLLKKPADLDLHCLSINENLYQQINLD